MKKFLSKIFLFCLISPLSAITPKQIWGSVVESSKKFINHECEGFHKNPLLKTVQWGLATIGLIGVLYYTPIALKYLPYVPSAVKFFHSSPWPARMKTAISSVFSIQPPSYDPFSEWPL
ncbi:MAG: hypothetical protein WA432_04925 [Candidatus Babeliaceae bacterium]